MRLVIGGYAQGKLNYVLQSHNGKIGMILDGELPEKEAETEGTIVLNHFHSWVKKKIAGGGAPEKEIREFIQGHPNCVIISNEIGCGIVPMEAAEREYRERTGRILTELAGQAEGVERVVCGIGQKIK